MPEAFIGEIRSVGFSFTPVDWLPCDGSLQPVSVYQALFSLIGTTYGGDGIKTFALPDLRGRVPIGQGAGAGSTIKIGAQTGSDGISLGQNQNGAHNHVLNTGRTAKSAVPNISMMLGDVAGEAGQDLPPAYAAQKNLQVMSPQALAVAGASIPHENRQPFVAVNFIIAAFGIYPGQA